MRTRRVVATSLLASSLVVTACSTDDGTLDLADDGPPAAAAPSEEPQVEPETDGVSDPTDPSDGEDGEQLYPPLPALEPDPELEISVADQELFLGLHAEMYEITQNAIATNDAGRLSEVLHGELLDQIAASVEAQQADGIVTLWPDGVVESVVVIHAAGGPGELRECVTYGPRTGIYDAETGEFLEGGRTGALVVTTRYELVEVDGELDYRAVRAESQHEEDCRATPS